MVDDEANNRDMLSRRLERRGYAVDVADSGQDALEKISRGAYDLVLLDQMMPGMTGLDLLRLLRATHSQSELPVIMVTAIDQSESLVEALDQGANDYVTKPVDLPVVNARIQAQLSRSKSDRAQHRSDALTGLNNRGQFVKLLTALLAQNDTRQVAVVLMGLDRFKMLNDSFGHQAGDKVLLETATRLKANAPKGSIIGRMGDDEFGVVIDNACQELVLAEIDKLLRCLDAPILHEQAKIMVNASGGIAFSAHSGTAEDLVGNADLAMHRAKELGASRVEVFTPVLRERAQTRLSMAIDLRQAIERGQLVTYYQPKIHLATRAIVGFEALLRWNHPERGLVAPYEFIPLAEETGLIVPIGEWVLREACNQLKRWHTLYPSNPQLSMNVNLSVKQLSDPQLVERVQNILRETGLPDHALKLELTESSLVTEIESAREVLKSLQSLKVGLNLDDFGTGYSSLSYLRTLHFDTLKIDRSFVSRLACDPESFAIVEAILKLADTLNMDVVAEGIEEEDQLSKLIVLGCEVGQGFLFSKPVPAAAAEAMLMPRVAA